MIMNLNGELWDVVDMGNGEATYTMRGTYEMDSLVCTVRPSSFAFRAEFGGMVEQFDTADFHDMWNRSLMQNLTMALDAFGELEDAECEDDTYDSDDYYGDDCYTDYPDSDLWNEY